MRDSSKHIQEWQEDMYWNFFMCQGFISFLPADFHERLAIPPKFANKLRKKLPETAILKGPSGLTWSVKLSSDGDTMFFADGWPAFVKDHSLEQNDLLTFRFTGESGFDVWIHDTSDSCEKVASYFLRGSRDAAGPSVDGQPKRKEKAPFVAVKSSEEGDERASSVEKWGKEDSYITPSDKSVGDDDYQVPSRQCCNSPSRPKKIRRLKTSDTDPAHNRGANTKSNARGRSGRKSGGFKSYVSNRRPVTQKEIDNTLQAARVAGSPGCLEIVMQPGKIRPRIKARWVRDHLSAEAQDVILRVKEQTWTVRFYLEKSRSGLLTTNWKNFVLDNGLEAHDVCLFKPGGRGPDQKFIIDVRIFRVVDHAVTQTGVNSPL